MKYMVTHTEVFDVEADSSGEALDKARSGLLLLVWAEDWNVEEVANAEDHQGSHGE